MTHYISPFDRIQQGDARLFDMSQDPQRREKLHKYTGTLEQAIDETLRLFEGILVGDAPSVLPEEILKLMLMNARIIRGILDIKCFPQAEKYIQSIRPVRAWIDMSESVYTLSPGAIQKLKELKNLLQSVGDIDILQRYDAETWKSMHPAFSEMTVHKITQEIGRDDYVLIALGHGGVMSGFDIFLRLQNTLEGEGNFYTVRFSRAKKKDKIPRVQDQEEHDYISSIIRGKNVILFDEDASSGNTLRYAKTYFESHFSGYNRVLLYSNIGVYGIQR